MAALPATLGVFEVASDDGEIQLIGYAGGRSLFGLRSSVTAALARDSRTSLKVRVEQNMQYISRWKELLMLHIGRHGALPPLNDSNDIIELGRLGPAVQGDRP
ncbi:hypothetical protein [Sphingomonas sp. OV641]|uniref:DUF7508 domain-containing protein n=1 Tax=Sphingomonas sp. OV641 TaxID=1881068 RepID=UPI000B86BCFE|nr:hypothetical protein [Sphingomonas sp. OV641]